MTKEQALKNLSVSADADIETIRIRFAARYTQSDTQYDRTLTEGMKAVHEQHLRELEQAYKVATDNPVIADMGALLSLGKGYVEENGASIGGDDTITADEALAFFALYPHDRPVLAEERYTQYVAELEEAMEQVGLEASKEPYRREMARAEARLQVVINYLLASQVLAAQQEEAGALEIAPADEPEMEAIGEPAYKVPTPQKAASKRYGFIAIAAIALLAIGIWIGRGSGTDGNDDDTSNTSAQHQTETEHITPATTEKSTAEPASSKPAIANKSSTQKDTSEQKKPSVTEPKETYTPAQSEIEKNEKPPIEPE